MYLYLYVHSYSQVRIYLHPCSYVTNGACFDTSFLSTLLITIPVTNAISQTNPLGLLLIARMHTCNQTIQL